MISKQESIDMLLETIAKIKDPEMLGSLFGSICTYDEFYAVSQRFLAAQMLIDGKPFSEIAAALDTEAMWIGKLDAILKNEDTVLPLLLQNEGDSYHSFAKLYDSLMQNADYPARADYIQKLVRKFGKIPTHLMLDLGCGTGSMTKILSDRGYDMIGVDNSIEMLDIARDRLSGSGALLLQQPMQDFELYGTVDLVICLMDSVNYLLDTSDLQNCFSLVHNYLNPGGLFIFDINTPYRLEQVLSGNTFSESNADDSASYVWQSYFDNVSQICQFDLQFFSKLPDGNFRRFEETHFQRAWTDDEICQSLCDAGLTLLGCFDDLCLRKPSKTGEKTFYIAQR